MIHKPEMTMFHVVKAGTLHCDNTDGCMFCDYHCFCEKVVSAITCLRTKFQKDYERIYGMITEDDVTSDNTKRGIEMSRKNENETMIKNISTNFTGTSEEGKLYFLGNIFAILMDISKSLAIIADEKQDHEETDDKETLELYTTRCTSCGKISPIGNYCIWCGKKDTCLEGGDEL